MLMLSPSSSSLSSSLPGKGYPEHERKNFIPIIYNNIITSMKVLVQQCDSFAPVNAENEGHKKLIEDLKGDEEIDDAIGQALQALWQDPGIQVTYDNRAAYQLTDRSDSACIHGIMRQTLLVAFQLTVCGLC